MTESAGAGLPGSRQGSPRQETRGLILGFIGVAIFSLTLPATCIAVVEMGPL